MPFMPDSVPQSRDSRPASTFNSVDLPVPFPPTRPVFSFGVISQSRPSNRSLCPNRFPASVSCSIPSDYCRRERLALSYESRRSAACFLGRLFRFLPNTHPIGDQGLRKLRRGVGIARPVASDRHVQQ